MKDILEDEVCLYQKIEKTFREVAESFSYKEIRVPILERSELFSRSIGSGSDIVRKELYSFRDRDGEELSLRPEGTAGIVRAYLEHSPDLFNKPARLYYMGPMFRHEKPQKGRFREFYQLGVENIGSSSPFADFEIIMLLQTFLEKLGISGEETRLEVNSIGCRSCRGRYIEDLIINLKKESDSLCDDCIRRLESNPLRVFDCKKEGCRQVIAHTTTMADYICSNCRNHFDQVLSLLSIAEIGFDVNPYLVRGLDYYTGVVFEQKSSTLGAQDAIAGGGRYDNLIEDFGGEATPASGFAAGVERLVLMIESVSKEKKDEFLDDSIYLVLDENDPEVLKTVATATKLFINSGLKVNTDLMNRSLKSQMRRAGKSRCRWVVIPGKDELERGKVVLRDMQNHSQREVRLESIPSIIEGERYE